jgi:transcription initiation factor TFIID subunit 3
MTSPPAFFHAVLRPTILQILRSTGYHTTRPAVLDSLTDLTARYLQLLCEGTARHATHNHGDAGDFDLVDVRLALQDAGAMLPERAFTEQMWRGEEDLRGVEDFIGWFAGQRMKELMETGKGDGEVDATDYLNGKSSSTHSAAPTMVED